MKNVPISELKSRLSEYLQEVKSGTHIVVTDRGKPVAELTAYGSSSGAHAEEEQVILRRLHALGSIRMPQKRGPLSKLKNRPKMPPGIFASEILIRDRENH